jgi:hypothetical protein
MVIHRIPTIYNIYYWKGLCKIKDLSVRPLEEGKDENIYNKLVARGRKFEKYAIGRHYLQYTGHKGRKNRVMINAHQACISGVKEDKVKEEEIFMCVPSLYGFNFISKNWENVNVELLEGIILNIL